MKIFCVSKDTIKKVNKKAIEWGKNLESSIQNIKEFLQLSIKKTNNPI